MKMVCPVCGREGVVQKRGNSVRLIHYRWVDGKRVFECHTVKKEWKQQMATWQQMATENGFLNVYECSGRDLNPRLRLERPEYLTGLYYRST